MNDCDPALAGRRAYLGMEVDASKGAPVGASAPDVENLGLYPTTPLTGPMARPPTPFGISVGRQGRPARSRRPTRRVAGRSKRFQNSADKAKLNPRETAYTRALSIKPGRDKGRQIRQTPAITTVWIR